MFAMICTDNLRYKKTKYYDSEYVIKGTLHINEHAYAFSHYDGAFEVLGIRWLSNYTKGRYSKDTGLEFSIGADTEEGQLWHPAGGRATLQRAENIQPQRRIRREHQRVQRIESSWPSLCLTRICQDCRRPAESQYGSLHLPARQYLCRTHSL